MCEMVHALWLDGGSAALRTPTLDQLWMQNPPQFPHFTTCMNWIQIHLAAGHVHPKTTTNTTTVTATEVGGNNNGCNSNGRGHRQQSTKIGSEDMVVVATAMETAAAGAATTAAGVPMTALGIGSDGIASATAWEGCGCWL
jgi:hypothetical protein